MAHFLDADAVPLFYGARGYMLPVLKHHFLVMIHESGIDARLAVFM